MAVIVRNDEQIQVSVTPGLVAGSSSFTFDGTLGKPDYRGYEIVISEYTGRSPMIKGLDFSWNYNTGEFNLLLPGDSLRDQQWYSVHFENPIVQPINPSPSSLIDATYFIRNITIPNIDAARPNSAVNLDRLNSFILKYEPECLINILGYSLYKALLTETSQRMTDLIYGAEYEDCIGDTVKWDGLIQPSVKISLIANYIYYYYTEAFATQSTGVNTQLPKGENAVPYSPGDKMLYAWNFFSEHANELYSFLWSNNKVTPFTYPEFTRSQYCKSRDFSRSNNSPF